MSGPSKAFLMTELGDRIDCLFNPADLTIEKTSTWSGDPIAGKDAPPMTFGGGATGTIALTLWFDTTNTGQPVTDYTTKLLELQKVNPDLSESTDPNSKTGRPPWVRFHWGKMSSFKAVVQKLKIQFKYFSSEGTPLRASAEITLWQFHDEGKWPLQNPTSGTPHPHAVHQVQAGETLDRIAVRRYGDPTRWRTIAEANHILDPLRLQPGMLLMIPDQETVVRG